MAASLRESSVNIVFGGVLFNLICELWVHGAVGFMNPVLAGSLIVLYVSYFLMLEDLVVRYRLGDKHVFLVGAIFGLWHETFTTGSVFAPESPIGLNPLIILIAIVFWWGILQSVMGLYFANRVMGERRWGHKKMGKLGWELCLFFSLQAVQTFLKLSGSSITGYTISLCILLVLALVIVFSKKPDKIAFFQSRIFLDFLVTLQVVLSLSIGFTVGSKTNQVTQIAFIIWSVLVGISIAIYRWRNGTIIPV